MEARVHHRLAWILGAALVGVAACGGGEGEQKGSGTPGGTGGPPGGRGNAPVQCVGPQWFGQIDEGARTKVVDLVCADARSGSIMAGRLTGDAGPTCKGAFAVKSDDEIAAILAAVDQGQAKEGNVGEAGATSQSVRDFAHLDGITHARSGDEQKAMLRRSKARAQDDSVSRALHKGFDDAETSLHKASGPGFDRELMSREIIQHARALEMLAELHPQAKGEDIRCAVEKAQDVMQAHLSLACVVWSTLPPPEARPTGRQAQAAGLPQTQGAPAATSTPAAPSPAEPGPATQSPATQAPATESPATESPATQAPATQAPVEQAPATPAPAMLAAPATADPPPTMPCEPCP